MYQEQILTSLVNKRLKRYTPCFHVKREKRGWRLFDGDTAVAFCYSYFFDIWSFSPFEPPIMANPEPPRKVIDMHTLHNTQLNLAPNGWPRRWLDGRPPPEEQLKWRWTHRSGATLEARISGAFPDGERARWTLRVCYDPAWARYRYTIDIDARRIMPDGFEPLNMMMAGALQARARDRRWTHSIWEDNDGNLRRLVHSNALFAVTDYGSDDWGELWRTRNVPVHGAWIAYAAHKTFNPAVVIHRANVPLRLATCSQLFDEHIIWNDAGQEDLGRDGYFHFHMAAELVNMKAAMARAFLKKALDPVQPARWRHQAIALPFHMDVVNSFEEPIDVWQPQACPIITVPATTDGPLCWTDEAAHTGRRSLRLQAGGNHERQAVKPGGAVCNVQPHRRYRLSGWIKTRSVDRFARLELASFEYSYNNTIDSAVSANVTGTKAWTRVEVELDSGEQAYLLPRFVLHGAGVAWFDDVQLAVMKA